MIKTLFKLGIERNFLNLIKVIYKKSTVNNIFNGKKTECAGNIENQTRMTILTTVIPPSTGHSSQHDKATKEVKGEQVRGRNKTAPVGR